MCAGVPSPPLKGWQTGNRHMADIASASVNGSGELHAPTRPRQAPPVALVIFGASGDLTRRKLVPALFDLFQDGLLAHSFAVLGFGRSALSDEQFRDNMKAGVQRFSRHAPASERAWKVFSLLLHYQSGQSDDLDSYRRLQERLVKIDQEHGTSGNRLFYLATPPELFPVITCKLGEAGLN